MKNSKKFFLILAIAAIFNIYSDCKNDPAEPSPEWEGQWETTYFETNGLDVTAQYQMLLTFEHGDCTQELIKPGAVLIATLPYSDSSDGATLTIGSTQLAVTENNGTDVVLEYKSGSQPAGYIQPWKAKFSKIR